MVQFTMEQLSIKQFAILGGTREDIASIAAEAQFGLKPSEKGIVTILDLKLLDAGQNTLVVLQTECLYHIDEKSFKGFSKENKYVVEKKLLTHFLLHAFGAARGILICKFEGTQYSGYVLPPTNVEEIVDRDAVFE